MRFFTLIHIEKEEQSIHNNGFLKSFDDQIDLYFSCAKQLHLSLKSAGLELVVLTNDKEFLNRLKNGYDIQIIQLDFSLIVPSGVKFFSAHFKIEIYNYLASLGDKYIGLIDCDIVCVNAIPQCFKNIIASQIPLYYDITDQITPAYSAKRIIADKGKLSKTKSIGLWAGGEFLAGPPSFFAKLYKEILDIRQIYFRNFSSFCHQGSEMLTSAAIENMLMKSDVRIIDAGSLSIIGRFWSHLPVHVQKRVDAYGKHFLFHIPSDKNFIKNLSKYDLKGVAFFNNYKRHLFFSHLIQNSFGSIKPYIKKIKKRFFSSVNTF